MTAGQVICKALSEGKSCEDIHALLKASHPETKAARDVKSCRQQVAWYRSQLNRKLLILSPSGELIKSERTCGNDPSLNDDPRVGSELRMKPARRNLKPARDILLELFNGSEKLLAGFLLGHTHFIHPDRILKHCKQNGNAALFPDRVRSSNQHHPGKRKGDESRWGEQKVRVCDNTTARLAFARFSGLVMAGDRVNRIRGYHVAHIWEHVYDPACFTAGWNLCLMPGFLKLFTEQQDRIELLHQVIQQAAFDLYFKGCSLGLQPPEFVTTRELDLNALFPEIKVNLL